MEELSKCAKDRIELAKALIRASEKSRKPSKKSKKDDATEGSTAGAQSSEKGDTEA